MRGKGGGGSIRSRGERDKEKRRNTEKGVRGYIQGGNKSSSGTMTCIKKKRKRNEGKKTKERKQ